MNPTPQTVPAPARWLGIAGLAPFFVLVALGMAIPAARAGLHFPLVAYGAVVLTFVGALHWGVALVAPESAGGRGRLLAWSVVPALVAWTALMLPAGFDLLLLLVSFWLHLAFDAAMARRYGLPQGYRELRLMLTIGVSVALVIALAQGTRWVEAASAQPPVPGLERLDSGAGCPALRRKELHV